MNEAGLDRVQQAIDETRMRFGILDHDDVATIFEWAGLNPLAFGAGRVAVALSDERVAKLAWQPGGKVASRIEDELYKKAPGEIRELLCPVYGASPGGVLSMARCAPTRAERIKDADEVVKLLSAWGILDTRVNLGMLNHRSVCYDYGKLSLDLQEWLSL